MKKLHKKIIGGLLPIPFLFAITVCCCLERDASADESVSKFSPEHHQELETSNHSEHQHDSQGDDECSCPKHFSFLSEQSADIVFNATFSYMFAKDFLNNFGITQIALRPLLSNQSQGPPWEDHLDHVSIPIYLKISNLRL